MARRGTWLTTVIVLLCVDRAAIFATEPAAWQSDLSADLHYLSSDELKGRGVGDESIDVAAKHIAGRFTEAGLRTDLFDGGPFQSFSIALESRPGPPENNRGVFAVRGQDAIELKLGETLMPLAIGCDACRLTDRDVVFVGYGIDAPEHDYDDYAGVDVTDKAVIVIRKEPGPGDPDSPFGGTRNTRHAWFQTKIEEAARRGAVAVLFVNDSASIRDSAQLARNRVKAEQRRAARLEKQLSEVPAEAVKARSDIRLQAEASRASGRKLEQEVRQAERGLLDVMDAGSDKPTDNAIPVVSIARDVADELLRRSTGRTLGEIQADIDADYRPRSRRLDGIKLTLKTALLAGDTQSQNVLGVIDGKGGLADQTIVIGAHYDHVGMGGYGSLAPGTIAVHNGADDNASGTGTLIAAATRLSAWLKDSPVHRRVVFIAFTGEERGLLGSKHYVRRPRFPLSDTVAMLNMDMVGRLRDNELTVYGTGSSGGFDALVENVNSQGLSLPIPVPAAGFDLFKVATGYGPSDHASFYEVGIPVLFFFTGLHNDYHRPSDDFDKLNLDGMRRICDLVTTTAYRLATDPARPIYLDTEKPLGGVRRQLTVYLGISIRTGPTVWDRSGRPAPQSQRLVLTDVKPRSPAANAGLRIGDTLMKFGNNEIRSLTELYDDLRKRSPGQSMSIEVIRDGSRQTFTAKPARR